MHWTMNIYSSVSPRGRKPSTFEGHSQLPASKALCKLRNVPIRKTCLVAYITDVTDASLLHYTPFTRYNRLSNRFDNRFDNRVERTATVISTGCETGLYSRFVNRLYTPYCRLSNRTGWMFLYTIQPVVTPVWQQVVSCKRGFRPTFQLG